MTCARRIGLRSVASSRIWVRQLNPSAERAAFTLPTSDVIPAVFLRYSYPKPFFTRTIVELGSRYRAAAPIRPMRDARGP